MNVPICIPFGHFYTISISDKKSLVNKDELGSIAETEKKERDVPYIFEHPLDFGYFHSHSTNKFFRRRIDQVFCG